MGMGTKKRTGLWRAKERRRSARNRTRVVDAMWETGEAWVERGKHVDKKRVGSVAANPDNLENSKEALEVPLYTLVTVPTLNDLEARRAIGVVLCTLRWRRLHCSLLPPSPPRLCCGEG